MLEGNLKKKIYSLTVLLFSLLILFSSCSNNAENEKRIYLDSGWTYSPIGDPGEFFPVPDNDLSHLSELLDNRTGYIFLKKQFNLPHNYKHKELSLFIGRVKIASKIYINNHFLAQSGFFPPNEFTEGERSVYCKIPNEYLNFSDSNTILICVWCHDYGTIKSIPFISDTEDITHKAEFDNLIYSKIYMLFSIVLILVFIIYLFLYFLRRSESANLSFALLCLATACYLVVFYIGEYSVIYQNKYSFLLLEKIFNGASPLLTCYFIICFTRDFLEYDESKKYRYIRIVVSIFAVILIFIGQDIISFRKLLIISFCIMFLLFVYPIALIVRSLKRKEKKVYMLLLGFVPVYITLFIQLITFGIFKKAVNSLMISASWIMVILLFLSMLIIRFVQLASKVEYMNKNLENLVEERTTALGEEKERAIREIELASFVQQSFFKIDSDIIDNWELKYFSKPMAGVSGDMYMAFNPNNKLDGLGIFDVSGHGIASGLVTMLVKNIIEQEFYRGLQKPLDEVMSRINDRIIKEKGNIENYLTGMLIRIRDNNMMELVNAGHPKALFYNSAEQKLHFIEKENVSQYGTIGIDGFPITVDTIQFEMNKGDEIILYTDGITEAVDSNNNEFGTQGIIDMFNKNKDKSVDEQVMAIREELTAFTGSDQFNDDITYIILKKE